MYTSTSERFVTSIERQLTGQCALILGVMIEVSGVLRIEPVVHNPRGTSVWAAVLSPVNNMQAITLRDLRPPASSVARTLHLLGYH